MVMLCLIQVVSAIPENATALGKMFYPGLFSNDQDAFQTQYLRMGSG